jgi:hypothetical protein
MVTVFRRVAAARLRHCGEQVSTSAFRLIVHLDPSFEGYGAARWRRLLGGTTVIFPFRIGKIAARCASHLLTGGTAEALGDAFPTRPLRGR